MFNFFERLIDPYPLEHPSQPPTGLYEFCRHYTKGIEPYLIMMAVLTALLAVGEAMLYGILGQLVDWLAEKNAGNFLQNEWQTLLGMTLFILVAMPVFAGNSPNVDG